MVNPIKTLTVAQAIVEIIKQEKIDYVFSVPGESYLPLLDALYDNKEIKLISARHEGGAAFMAEGYGKTMRKPGIVMATRGVGAANLSIGVHTAYQDSTPMVVFLGQVRSDFRGREGFQEVDFEQFFAPLTKWAVEINNPKRTFELVQKAFFIARSGRPGPVVVSLPEDILSMEVKEKIQPYVHRSKPSPSIDELSEIERILKRAKRPLILAGGGVKLAKAEEELIAFAEKYSLPVMSAFRRHDVFPNSHGLYAGHLGIGTDEKIIETVGKADVILAIGTRLSEVTTQDYALIHPDHHLIHIDISEETLHKVYTPDIAILSDAKEALHALKTLPLSREWKEWSKVAHQSYKKASKLPDKASQILNDHIIKMLLQELPTNSVITNDAGNFATWLHRYYIFQEKETYIGPTSGSMGYALPAAIGAKLANPSRKVIALAGDGGFMMTLQELETAVRYNIPVIAIVFNNEMYGTIRMHQEIHYPGKVIGTDLGKVSFKKIAEGLGAKGYYVETKEQFDEAFLTALEKNCVSVIEVKTEQEHISVNQTITTLRNK